MDGQRRSWTGLLRALSVLLGVLWLAAAPAAAQTMIIGIDEKVTWDAKGKQIFVAPGKDAISVVDISNPEAPRITANLPLMNSIFGPPVNLAISPDGKLALVANSMDWQKDGDAWKPAPDNKLYVIDLTVNPAAQIGTVEVGKQPSGLSFNRAGKLVLVANRADNSISVLTVSGKDVKLVDTVRHGRAGRARGLHAGRQARAGGEVPRPQDRPPGRGRSEGDLLQVRPPGRALALQRGRDAAGDHRAHRRQRECRGLRRPRRYGQCHRSRSDAPASDRQSRRGGRPRGARHQPARRPRGGHPAPRQQRARRSPTSTTATAAW